MTIVGGKTVGDRRVYDYGCGARQSRGPSACANKSTESEGRMLGASPTALRSLLASESFEAWVADIFPKRVARGLRGALLSAP